MKVLAIIPSRYHSTRLPAKPLIDIVGKSMIRRVYEQVSKCCKIHQVIVATDDNRIVEECKRYNMNCMMTKSSHENGTERCAEIVESLDNSFDIVINVQGDEPFINPKSIENIIDIFHQNKAVQIGTLYQKITDSSDIFNPNSVKIVKDIENNALYFSRNPIPYLRDENEENWMQYHTFIKHIGMYAYTPSILKEIVQLQLSSLEKTEKLEQLRWLENGYKIQVAETIYNSKSIDTIEDYNYILAHINEYINE